MTRKIIIGAAVFFALCGIVNLISPAAAYSFGGEGEGCGEGECKDCHYIDLEETRELLKGVVDTVERVDFAEVPGLFICEVSGQGQRGVLYLDFSKKFIITGKTFKLEQVKENLARTRDREKIRVDLTTIPLDDALVLGSKKAKYKVLVFTDPQCPWCKKLHPVLKEVVRKDPDIAFYIKLYPITSLHPDAPRISRSIICQDSMELLEQSFANLEKGAVVKPIPDPTCQTDQVERNIALARANQIISTPTMVMPDGSLAEGGKWTPEQIIERAKRK
jgi:thiol:disulfide interchange protein DsbC